MGLVASPKELPEGPLIFDHNPVPDEMEFAARVVDVTLHRLWSAPALAVVGLAKSVMETSS